MDLRFHLYKKGLSTVVSTVILIVLVVVAVSIIWVFVSGIINDKIDDSESCFGVFEDVTLNGEYTCFDNQTKELQFSIDIKDIELEGILVSISNEEGAKSFTITYNEVAIDYLKNYGGTNLIKLPEKNSGLTYKYEMGAAGFTKWPGSIKIAPIIDGTHCEVSDTISQFYDCENLA